MGTGDAAGDATGEATGEAEVSGSGEAAGEPAGLAAGVMWTADPCPPQLTTRIATASRNVGFTGGIIGVRSRRSAARFAASAAGAKETTSTRGSASRRCGTERAQEATPASAP